MPEPELNSDLTALAAALGRLAPAPPALDRDRLFFEAGRRAACPRPWAWPLATALCATVAAALGLRLLTRPEPPPGPPRERVIYVQVPARTEPETAPSPAAPVPSPIVSAPARAPDAPYLKLRDAVLRWGVDVLHPQPAAATAPRPVSIEQLLGLPPGSLNDAQKARWLSHFPRGEV